MQPTNDQPQNSFPQTPENPFTPAQMQAGMIQQQLTLAFSAAGSNFYSIAVFSLINSVINYFEGNVYFPIGLGITQIVDGFSAALQQELPQARMVIFGVNVALNLLIVGLVALTGFIIKKRVKWLIAVGGGLYLLDGLLVLLFQDWIGGAFHAYFLYRVWTNWQFINRASRAAVPQSAIETI
jgi:hypothetical protein